MNAKALSTYMGHSSITVTLQQRVGLGEGALDQLGSPSRAVLTRDPLRQRGGASSNAGVIDRLADRRGESRRGELLGGQGLGSGTSALDGGSPEMLVTRLLADAGFDVVGKAEDAAGLMRRVELTRPDVAIVDIKMPPTHTDEGIAAAQEIRRAHPQVGVLVLSQYLESRYALRLLEDAPDKVGYLLKDRVSDIAVLADALKRIDEGECVIDPTIVSRLLKRPREQGPLDELTGREREVLALMAEGRSNGAISHALFLSPKTVEANVRQIFRKLGLQQSPDEHRRVLAVLAYLRVGPAD